VHEGCTLCVVRAGALKLRTDLHISINEQYVYHQPTKKREGCFGFAQGDLICLMACEDVTVIMASCQIWPFVNSTEYHYQVNHMDSMDTLQRSIPSIGKLVHDSLGLMLDIAFCKMISDIQLLALY